MKVKCPICKGLGEIEAPKRLGTDFKRRATETLRDNGFSLRDIQKYLGYKSVCSVQHFLKQEKK